MIMEPRRVSVTIERNYTLGTILNELEVQIEIGPKLYVGKYMFEDHPGKSRVDFMLDHAMEFLKSTLKADIGKDFWKKPVPIQSLQLVEDEPAKAPSVSRKPVSKPVSPEIPPEPEPPPPEPAKCLECGKDLSHLMGDWKFCGKACEKAYTKRMRTCPVCDQDFLETEGYMAYGQLCCSVDCVRHTNHKTKP